MIENQESRGDRFSHLRGLCSFDYCGILTSYELVRLVISWFAIVRIKKKRRIV